MFDRTDNLLIVAGLVFIMLCIIGVALWYIANGGNVDATPAMNLVGNVSLTQGMLNP